MFISGQWQEFGLECSRFAMSIDEVNFAAGSAAYNFIELVVGFSVDSATRIGYFSQANQAIFKPLTTAQAFQVLSCYSRNAESSRYYAESDYSFRFTILAQQLKALSCNQFRLQTVKTMNAQITEDQINRQLDQLKEFQTSAKKEILKKVEANGKHYKEEFEQNYSDFMYINSVFGNQRALDQLVREVFPSMKFKHKQEEKKLLRHIGKVFLQQLVEMSVLAKHSSGKEALDADCVREGYRRFQQGHAPIRKNKGYRRLI